MEQATPGADLAAVIKKPGTMPGLVDIRGGKGQVIPLN